MTGGTLCHWIDSRNNIAMSSSTDHLIAGIGIEDLVIVHTDDVTLICRREETDHLKTLLEQLGQDKKLSKYL